MPAQKAPLALAKGSHKAIRQQLDGILGSRTFQAAERLKRFLNFTVVETLAGRSDQLKEYVVAVNVFGKEESFDARTDPLVRVQARRLRARLARYYRDEGQEDQIVIDLPKGGYAPVFRSHERNTLQKRSMSATLAVQNSVAVLPFSNDSGSADLDCFCKGLREEIIHHLARMDALRVLVSDSTDLGRDRDALQSDRLHAAMVIAGSVRASGVRLRVTVQLIDGVSGRYFWSEAIEGTLADTLSVQGQVADVVVQRLGPELNAAVKPRSPGRTTENLAAKNLYLQDRYYLNQRTEESLQKAREFFEKAVAEDPQYALAHSGLADAYGLLGHYAVLRPAEVWTKTAAGAATAVMLDGDSAEARTSLAHVKSTQDWDWLGAQDEFRRAISLDPRYPTAHHWYAISCLVPMGRLDEALAEMQVAQALDPVSSIIARDLAITKLLPTRLRHRARAVRSHDRAEPAFLPAYWLLGFIQEQRGDLDESIAAFQRAVHLSPHSPRMQSALARALALSGKRQLALKLLKSLQHVSKQRYVSPFEFAAIHFALEEQDHGFRWLSKAADDRAFEMTALKVDPRVQAVKEDARFAATVKRPGLD